MRAARFRQYRATTAPGDAAARPPWREVPPSSCGTNWYAASMPVVTRKNSTPSGPARVAKLRGSCRHGQGRRGVGWDDCEAPVQAAASWRQSRSRRAATLDNWHSRRAGRRPDQVCGTLLARSPHEPVAAGQRRRHIVRQQQLPHALPAVEEHDGQAGGHPQAVQAAHVHSQGGRVGSAGRRGCGGACGKVNRGRARRARCGVAPCLQASSMRGKGGRSMFPHQCPVSHMHAECHSAGHARLVEASVEDGHLWASSAAASVLKSSAVALLAAGLPAAQPAIDFNQFSCADKPSFVSGELALKPHRRPEHRLLLHA